MQTALTTYLLADAGLAALIGTRLDWIERPQLQNLPSVTLTTISAPRTYHHGGATDLQRARVQADCWAADPLTAQAIAKAVITAVDAMHVGALDRGFIDQVFDVGPEDLGGGSKVHRTIVDFFVWHFGQ